MMVDPTSDLNEDLDEADAPTCAVCGTALVDHPHHRVITVVEDDEVHTTHFCDERCLAAWNE